MSLPNCPKSDKDLLLDGLEAAPLPGCAQTDAQRTSRAVKSHPTLGQVGLHRNGKEWACGLRHTPAVRGSLSFTPVLLPAGPQHSMPCWRPSTHPCFSLDSGFCAPRSSVTAVRLRCRLAGYTAAAARAVPAANTGGNKQLSASACQTALYKAAACNLCYTVSAGLTATTRHELGRNWKHRCGPHLFRSRSFQLQPVPVCGCPRLGSCTVGMGVHTPAPALSWKGRNRTHDVSGSCRFPM